MGGQCWVGGELMEENPPVLEHLRQSFSLWSRGAEGEEKCGGQPRIAVGLRLHSSPPPSSVLKVKVKTETVSVVLASRSFMPCSLWLRHPSSCPVTGEGQKHRRPKSPKASGTGLGRELSSYPESLPLQPPICLHVKWAFQNGDTTHIFIKRLMYTKIATLKEKSLSRPMIFFFFKSGWFIFLQGWENSRLLWRPPIIFTDEDPHASCIS